VAALEHAAAGSLSLIHKSESLSAQRATRSRSTPAAQKAAGVLDDD